MAGSTARVDHAAPAPRSRRAFRWLAYLIAFLLILLTVAAGAGYAVARRSLPTISGELQLAGLSTPVTVYRDERGVPHIEASSLHDLYMAQGYVTAQDRLWQMDLSRRAAAGRLSEVMGESQLKTDRFMRTLNLVRAAEESVKSYEPWAKELLDAYAAGVNTYVEQAITSGKLPIEFTILGYKPEPWSIADSAIIGKFMAYDLGGNFASEVYRLQLRQKVGIDLADQLLPVYPEFGPTMIQYEGKSSASEPVQLASTPHVGGEIDLSGLLSTAYWPDPFVGSNNWVISGRLTQSGKPLLANDPHLAVRTPSIWYEQHLMVKDGPEQVNAYGVIFPGAPGIVIGQNDKIAWGVTNTAPDVQDLFVEKRNPENPYQFLYKGKWEDATVYKELIPVKGKEPVAFELVVTRHGPIVSEVVGSEKNRPQEALALKWTAHMGTPELEAVLRFTTAQNWDQFREALKKFQVPTQNFVFASVDGTIAYRAGGLVPVRAKGDGIHPVPGWTGEFEWTGFIPFDEMPESVNPAQGYIATANNKVIDDAYPHFITSSWSSPYRAMRIVEVLESKKGSLTAEDMQALQADYLNVQARMLLPVLLPAVEKASLSKTEREALALLRSWDYVESVDQGAPLLFHFWYDELIRLLYEPLMGEDLSKRVADLHNVTDNALIAAAKGNENDWIKAAGGLETLALSSYQTAVNQSSDLQGSNPAKWAWGEFHRMQPLHPIGGAVKQLGWILNPKALPAGGSWTTVAQMKYGKDGLVTNAGPWRQVVDFADPVGKSRSIVLPGQSGHFLSPYYGDQADEHNQGQLFDRHFTDYTSGHKLMLKP